MSIKPSDCSYGLADAARKFNKHTKGYRGLAKLCHGLAVMATRTTFQECSRAFEMGHSCVRQTMTHTNTIYTAAQLGPRIKGPKREIRQIHKVGLSLGVMTRRYAASHHHRATCRNPSVKTLFLLNCLCRHFHLLKPRKT